MPGKMGRGKVAFSAEMEEVKRSSSLNSVSLREDSIVSLEYNGFSYDMLWRPKLDTEKLFIFFSGSANRKKYQIPVFQRWTWSELFPGHCLYISDPCLRMRQDISLAWYFGDASTNVHMDLASIIGNFVENIGIKRSKVVLYGSSGGGFAAIQMLKELDESSAIVINPQVNIIKYHKGHVDRFLDVCLGGMNRKNALAIYENRLNVLTDIDRFYGKKLIYLQNEDDIFHLEEHYFRFLEFINKSPVDDGGFVELHTRTFFGGGGHSQGETKDIFEEAMKIASQW